MAKEDYNGQVSNLSGKLGDVIHSHTRNRKYAKKVTKKKFIKTEGRAKTMESFGSTVSGWNTLNDKQIDVWEERARNLRLRSIGKKAIIQTGRELYNYVNLNLYEIGEPQRIYAPGFDYPTYVMDINFKFINDTENTDIRLHFPNEIHENTKLIVYATHSIVKGQRKVQESWYKKIAVIDHNFKLGDSILAQYLRVYKEIKQNMYKISFKYREVQKISGISNMERAFAMYSQPDVY